MKNTTNKWMNEEVEEALRNNPPSPADPPGAETVWDVIKCVFFVAVVLALVLAGACGCTTFHTKQTDTVAEDGTYITTTEIKVRTFFDSKSELNKLKTSTTAKTQSVGVGALGQEASGSNAVQILKIIIEGAAQVVK